MVKIKAFSLATFTLFTETPLITAVYLENSEIVTLLLDAGADVNATSQDGRTSPLSAAYHKRSEAMIKLLTEYHQRAE